MTLIVYILLFFIYSFLGWLMETVLKSIEAKKFINRGFLIGPYCPIYGYGCVFIITLLNRFMDYPILVFFLSIIICSILEYFTSYFMEKIFKARWWDYSKRKFNIDGRICLNTMIPFGILGTLIIYYLNPFLMKNLYQANDFLIISIALVLVVIYITDNIISLNIISKFKSAAKDYSTSIKDNTVEVTEYVKNILLGKGFRARRILSAYPDFKANLRKIKG